MGCLVGIAAIVIGVPLAFGLDTALTSIFAYFGVEGWVVFAVCGLLLGLLGALLDEHEGFAWVHMPLFCALEGYVLWEFRPDGIVYCVLLALAYNWLLNRFDDD